MTLKEAKANGWTVTGKGRDWTAEKNRFIFTRDWTAEKNRFIFTGFSQELVLALAVKYDEKMEAMFA